MIQLPPSGNAADASIPLVPPADLTSTSDHQAGSAVGAGGNTCNATEGADAAGFLFLGGVLAEGVEELAVSHVIAVVNVDS